jgi:hypothetical protein
MTLIKRLSFSLALTLFAVVAHAQTPQLSSVNLTAEPGRVRASKQGEVLGLRMEVVDEAGDTVFEGAGEAGEHLDWNMCDSSGARVAPGTYTVTVSYTTAAGKSRKRIEQVLVTEEVTSQSGTEKTEMQAASAPQPNIAGTGAAGRLAKWVDNAGKLGNSVVTESANKIGINGVPTHALTINGGPNWTSSTWLGSIALPNIGAIGWASNSAGQRRGIGQANGGLFFFRTQSNPGGIGFPALYDMVISDQGFVGIGTTTPASKLHVGGEMIIDSATPTLHVGSASGEQNRYLHLINSPSHRSSSGIKAGGVLVADTYNFANPGKNDLIVKGQVGIGLAAPTAKLQVSGGGLVGISSATSEADAISGLTTAGASGVYGKNNSGSGYGVRGDNSGSGYGVYALNSSGFALGVEGNAQQSRDKGGLVKAMLLVRANGTIARCYNGQTGASLDAGKTTAGCGFAVTPDGGGDYNVDFGFKVVDRFFSATSLDSSVFSINIGARVIILSGSTTTVLVKTFHTDNGHSNTIADFYLLVF